MLPMRGAALALLIAVGVCAPRAEAAASAPIEGFVETNGVRLQYLDWGGTGPALILIHGLGDDRHAFVDLAPAFTDRFHVIAYACRGSGSSDVKGPYDTATRTEDLRGLMDALGIARADLAGSSAGGNEVTALAARYPLRVNRIIYLDAAYDGADPDLRAVIAARPNVAPPASAFASLSAWLAYDQASRFPGLSDARRIEAYQRAKVVVQPDGRVKERLSKDVRDALYTALLNDPPRDYARVRSPALVIYAEHYYPVPVQSAAVIAYERDYWAPFQMKSIDRIRRELPGTEVVQVPGAHGNFLFVSRQRVVEVIDRFLARTAAQAK